MMTTDIVTQIEQNLKQVMGEEANVLARQVGFVQRQRKLSGSGFAQVMVWGALDKPELSYTDLAQDAAFLGISVSPQGIEQRFNEKAAQFMQRLLEKAVQKVLDNVTPTAGAILKRFNGVYIRDSTVISLPAELKEVWPGCGGSSGDTAALKLQVRLNYTTGQVEGPALQAGREHDRTTPYGPDTEPPGSLTLSDLGYFSLEELRQRHEQGKYFLTRYKVGTHLYTPEGEPLDLVSWLSQEVQTVSERAVLVGEKERLPARLIAFRVPQEVADQRRRRLREYARKKGVTPTPETLFLAGWTILLTNVPAEMLSPQEAAALLKVRWQVEILFKVWKSQALVDEWRSRNPWRILCELYAKCIGLVMTHWLWLTEWHRFPDRSLFKAVEAVQRLALPLALAFRRGEGIRDIIVLFQQSFHTSCRQNKRRSKPATYQLLLSLEHEEGLT